MCVYSRRSGDTILSHHEGSMDIDNVNVKALKLNHRSGAKSATSLKQIILGNT